jgi:hypothetical protein
MMKTVAELKVELVRAAMNMWIELAREIGYERTSVRAAIDVLLREHPELFDRLREAAPSEVPDKTHFNDNSEVALWLEGEMIKRQEKPPKGE